MKPSILVYTFLSILGLLWYIPVNPYINYTSQTFMFTRPLFQTDSLFSATWAEFITNKGALSNHQLVVSALGLYQKSTDTCKTRSYFLMKCKPALLVAGDSSPLVVDRDIRSEFIGITDPSFEGTLTLQPEQEQGGIILSLNQHLGAYFDWDFIKTWWVDIAIPIFTVKNRLDIKGSSPEVIAGFNADNLAFARIDPSKDTKTGVGTIEIRVGGAFLHDNGFFLDYYSGIGIPAEGNPKPCRLFPATLGNMQHLTLINGGHFKMPINCFCEDDWNLRFFFTIENRYYVSNHQIRTFDLQGKQYSRYLPVRREGEITTIPAADILTFRVDIHPNSYTNLATGFELCSEHFTLDLSYRLWAHSREHIRFEHRCCDRTRPRFTEYGIAGTAPGTSASQSTIANLAPDDLVFVPLKESDIDYCSGLAGASIVQGFNAELYYQNDTFLAGIGGLIETPNNNAALQNWGIWLRLACDY